MLAIAHRGFHHTAPENTLEAFHQAVALGADGVELDIHCAATGEVVVIHDKTVNRTTNGRGKVAQMDWAALKALRIDKMHSIPLLEQAIETVGKEKYCFIEVKHPAAALPAAKIIRRYVAKGWDENRLVLISFNHRALHEARLAIAKLHIGASVERFGTDSIRQATMLGATFLLPYYKRCTALRIANAQKAGLQVIPWTVNRRRSMQRLTDIGIDGIISDQPQLLTASD